MQKGFTLAELLITVFIISILAAIALPQYSRSAERAKTAELLSNGKVMLDSMNRSIMLQPNVPPSSKEMLDVKIGGGRWTSNSTYRTRDFEYDISNGNYLLINRLMADGSVVYRAYMYTRLNPANENIRQCQWRTEVGQFACKLLGEQGYTVSQISGD